MNEALSLPFPVDDQPLHYGLKIALGNDADAAKTCLDTAAPLLESKPKHVIVDCGQVVTLSQAWVRTLLLLNQRASAARQQMRLVAVRPSLLGAIKADGLAGSLKVAESVEMALKDFAAKSGPAKLDVGFINPFLNATLKVLEMQCSLVAKAGSPFKAGVNDKLRGDISGVIALVADAFKGNVVITFPEVTFLSVMSKMLGEEFTVMSKDLEDGASELTNIIFGQAKVVLNEAGYGISSALPTVITGANHSLTQSRTTSRIVIPFQCPAGEFFVEVSIEV